MASKASDHASRLVVEMLTNLVAAKILENSPQYEAIKDPARESFDGLMAYIAKLEAQCVENTP